MLERIKRGELRKRGKMEQLEKKFNIRKKGITVVMEELKQRILVKAAKIKIYEQRRKQYKQNIMFKQDQKRFFLVRLHGEYNILVKLCGNTT